MELRDLIVTPFLIILVYIVAYIIRPHVTDSITRQYFFPALSVKIVGAIALGFIYQFYYQGGDTYNYHTHGSRIIWQAIMEDPSRGFSLLLGGNAPNLYKYSSHILFFSDPDSFFVIRIAAFFDLLTFSSYTGTAVLFAVTGFCGMWLFFVTFYSMMPHLHRWLAVAAFFIPSVFFWGSGLLKDTITMACLGFTTYAIKKVFIDRRFSIFLIVILFISSYVIFEVKKYILLCYLPAALLWVYATNLVLIRSIVLRVLLVPVVLILIAASGYYAIIKLSENDSHYALDKIAVTAQTTAYDIGFYTGRDAGSGYSLGELDGTMAGMLKLAPQAINVSLYRPYLWEVRNPFMLLSSLESLGFLILTLMALYGSRGHLISSLLDPTVLFCLVFSITFAFAVGIATFNFGTLVRYKIPLMPFFLVGMIIMLNQANKDKKVEVFDSTE